MERCRIIRPGGGQEGKQGLEYFAGAPHLPVNTGTTELRAVIARTDPNEQESVVLLPDLDAVPGRPAS